MYTILYIFKSERPISSMRVRLENHDLFLNETIDPLRSCNRPVSSYLRQGGSPGVHGPNPDKYS